MRNYYKPGTWNAICDVCGFKFKADELKKRWDGRMVCDADFETRHPSDLYSPRMDKPPAIEWSRPEAADTFVAVEYITDIVTAVDFTKGAATPVDFGFQIPFTSTVTGDAITYSWVFTSGPNIRTSAEANPTITFSAGIWTARLDVYGINGSIASMLKVNYI
jgi:hypothetical protein